MKALSDPRLIWLRLLTGFEGKVERGLVQVSTFYKTFLNPSLAEHDMPCLSKQCRSRSFGRASVKRTYGVYYALRLPPDVQIELQRRTADFRNFFCPSKIDTRDVQNCQKPRPLLTSCMMFAPPTYRKFTTCVHWASKDVPLSACGSFIDSRLTCRGTLLIAVWSLHVFVNRDELINWCCII